MSEPAWKDVRALAERALDLDAPGRAALLDEAARRDPALARAAREIVERASDGGEFLEPRAGAPALPAALPSGLCIGGYALVRELGSGGMGTVYEALQPNPRRSVALKLLRTGTASPEVLRRFEYEAAVLARLRHAGIAQVYGAGVHRMPGPLGPLDVPWIAMELVEGATDIVQHCAQHALGLRERLALFAQVCAAVQHGHEKGVIHRDLKPANVLVDAAGRPRVIDFGVARAVRADGDSMHAESLHTQHGTLVGTLRSMSPEQLGGDPTAVDTRSDVYSLGVLLYELLCGAPPHDLAGKSITEAARCVREQPATRPRVARPDLPRELEWVLLTALEKDPARRYGSATELGAEIRRFLASEPVLAGAPSAAYRFSKLVRRNGVASAFAAAALCALIGGTTASLLGWREARAQRDDARRETDKANAISEFLGELVRSPDPELDGKDLRVADALRNKAGEIATRFAAQPDVAAMLHRKVGLSFTALGLPAEAAEQMQLAFDRRRALDGPDARDTLEVEVELALALDEAGRDQEAEPLAREARTKLLAAFGTADSLTARATQTLGSLLIGRERFDEAEPLLEEALAMKRALYGENAAEVAAALNDLGVLYRETKRTDEAETALRAALEIWRAQQGETGPKTLAAETNLIGVLIENGRQEEALEINARSVAGYRARLGDEHPHTLNALEMQAILLERGGRLDEAEQEYRRLLELRIAKQGEYEPDTLITTGNLASLLSVRGRHGEAEPLLRRVLEARTRQFGAEARATLISMQNLSTSLRRQSKLAEAADLLERCVEIRTRVYGEHDSESIAAMGGLGALRFAQGDLARAEQQLRHTLDVARETLDADHYFTRTFEVELGRCLTAQQRYDEALPLLDGAYRSQLTRFGAAGPATRAALQALAQHYDARGMTAEAADCRARLEPTAAR